MSRKRNFLLTKKTLAAYLNISRTTLDKRLNEAQVSIHNRDEILNWLLFESMGPGKFLNRFREYIFKSRGEKCERCGAIYDLQVAHDEPITIQPTYIYSSKHVKVLCVDCHNATEKHPLIGNDKPFLIKPHLVRNPKIKL